MYHIDYTQLADRYAPAYASPEAFADWTLDCKRGTCEGIPPYGRLCA